MLGLRDAAMEKKSQHLTISFLAQISNKISLEISVPIAFKVQRDDLYLHTPDVYNVS